MKDLLEEIRTAITLDPSIVPDVLSAVSDGMARWQAGVKREMDMNAYNGIIAAFGLPRDLRNLSATNHQHRTCARLAAVGLNLGRRTVSSMSSVEQTIYAFVVEADTLYPADAAQHYSVIQCAPIGMDEKS